MAKIENGCLIIMEGDKYVLRGDTLVFLESGEEDGSHSEIEEVCGAVRSTRKCQKELS